MGFRFRKSFKIANCVRVNLGKKSVGMSIGNKYAGVNINSKNGVSTRISVPNTGISYTIKLNKKDGFIMDDVKKIKFCKHCGQKIDIDCVVCPLCGKQVEELRYDGRNIIINNSASSVSSVPQKKKKKYNLLLDILLVIFTGGLWFIWILVRPKYEY